MKSIDSAMAGTSMDIYETMSNDSGNESNESNINKDSTFSFISQSPSDENSTQKGLHRITINIESQPLIEKEEKEEKEENGDEDRNNVESKLGLWTMRPGMSSLSLTSTASTLFCRICHTSSASFSNPLVSPCRCSGSLLYIHKACLVHWLEMSTRKMVPSPRCELCSYNFKRSNIFHLRGVHLPHMELRDKILNILFVIIMIIMMTCGALCVHFIKMAEKYHIMYRGQRVPTNDLSPDDITIVVCACMFFASFFIAVFTQYRAEASIFRVIFRCWVINRNWTIKNYDIRDDPEMIAKQAARVEQNNQSTTSQSIRTNILKIEDRQDPNQQLIIIVHNGKRINISTSQRLNVSTSTS